MRNKLYITGIGGISAQNEDMIEKGIPAAYSQNIFPAIAPIYKDYIPAMALRRMSGAIKMGLTAAKMALEDACVEKPVAIITGTGQGCKQDTEKFLVAMLENEELLSPTSFIHSTHNTVGGQVALHLNCTGYNVTYSHNSGSLEVALLDAHFLARDLAKEDSLLVGGVDEISPKITPFSYLDGQLKQEEISNLELFNTNSPGTITSEGAHFFNISLAKKPEAYAELIDVDVFNANSGQKIVEKINKLLKSNDLRIDDIDAVILGNNGDNRFDHFYHALQNGIFENKRQLVYKHLVGDYNTVSGYALWLGCKILKNGKIPEVYKINAVTGPGKIKHILLYNQYLGENHSIILLGNS